jgi:hypothetical protein
MEVDTQLQALTAKSAPLTLTGQQNRVDPTAGLGAVEERKSYSPAGNRNQIPGPRNPPKYA